MSAGPCVGARGRSGMTPRSNVSAEAGPENGPDDERSLCSIGRVAAEVGLTPRAIRFYEEAGLFRPAIRVKGSDRLYDASDIQRLRDIKQLREVIGFSIE